MQASATDITGKMENSADSSKQSLDIMETITPLLSSNEIMFPDENAERVHTRYGYKVLNMNFLVPEGTVSEVIQNANIFSLPNAPVWIEGLINSRGNIIPVMNIAKLIKNFSHEKLTSILVLNKTDTKSAIAIMISDLPMSLEINDSKTTTDKYPDALHDYIDAGFSQNNMDWIEFNPQQLFKNLAGKTKA